jgi:hypothetical protein
MQEIEILGSQELYRLRRTIVCPFGYGVHQHKRHQKQRTRSSPRQQDDDQQDDDQQDDDQQDDDQQEEVENDVLNESLYYENDSSIMFIEDTFYTDSKNPSIERYEMETMY